MDLGRLLAFADRRRYVFLLLFAGSSLAAGAGILELRLETSVLDWLPAGHPNAEAFRRLFERLPQAANQEILWLELDAGARRRGVESVLDMEALRAQEDLVRAVKREVPGVLGDFGLLAWLRALHADLRRAGFLREGFLASEAETRTLLALLERAAPGIFEALLSEDHTGTVLALVLEGRAQSREVRETARRLAAALAEGGGAAGAGSVFDRRYLVPAGLASGLARIDDALARDLARGVPIAAGSLFLLLRLALGSWRATLLASGALATGAAWSLGLLGWLGARINIVTVAIVPLLLGCGVNAAILVSRELDEYRSRGLEAREALVALARGGGRAVVLTTLTTAGGLFLLVFSETPGLRDLGLHAAAGFFLAGAFTVFLLAPFRARGERFEPRQGRAARMARAVAARLARGGRFQVLLVVGAALAAALAAGPPRMLLDVVEGHFPPDAPIARVLERIRERAGGALPEIVIAEGDLGRAGAWRVLRNLEEAIARSAVLGGRYRAVGFPDVIALARLSEVLERARPLAGLGSQGLLLALGAAGGREALLEAARPVAPDSVRRAAKALLEEDLRRPLARAHFDGELRIGTVYLLGGDAGREPREVRRVWEELEKLLGRAEREAPPGARLRLSFLGYRTMSLLFLEHSRRWLERMALLVWVLVLGLSFLWLRSVRALLALGAVLAASGCLWYASLSAAGIYLSVFLLFPLVFTAAIGSDYTLHLLFRLRAAQRDGVDTGGVWSSALPAVSAAAATDALVFLAFVPSELVSASRVAGAVALAVAAVYAATLAVVPALARPPDPSRPPSVT